MKLATAAILLCVCVCHGCDSRLFPADGAVAKTSKSDLGLTSEQVRALFSEALDELARSNFGKASEITRRITKSDPTNIDSYIVLSQAQAMSGNLVPALDALDLAFKNGFRDLDRIAKEPHLDAIRATPEFQDLLRKHGLALPVVAVATQIRAGNVSIKEYSGEQVIKAGDLTIRVPKD